MQCSRTEAGEGVSMPEINGTLSEPEPPGVSGVMEQGLATDGCPVQDS